MMLRPAVMGLNYVLDYSETSVVLPMQCQLFGRGN